MEAREETPAGTPPQPSELEAEPSAMTCGDRLKDTGPYNWTTFHFNDVYDVDPRPEEPVEGDARLSDLIKYIQQGISLMHDLLALLPTVDPVLVVRATGAQLLEALENGVNK